MPNIKMTMRINWGTSAGWSETVYISGSSPSDTAVGMFASRWAIIRASCLTRNAEVLDVVATQEGAPGQSVIYTRAFPGALGDATLAGKGADVASVSLQLNLRAGATAKRQYMLRGLPDADVVGGLVTYAGSGILPYTNYRAFLLGNFAPVNIKDRTSLAPSPLIGVSGTGLVTVDGAFAVFVGDWVYIRTQVTGGGPRVPALCRVMSVNADDTFRVRPWTNGTCTGGTIRKVTYAYNPITDAAAPFPNRAKNRKVGRPFGSSRGKRATLHMRQV